MPDTTQPRFDGGATWLNLLATSGQTFGRRPVERLPTPEAATDWLRLAGLPPVTPATDADLTRLLRLRDALREVAMATVAQRPPLPADLAHVREAASSTAVLALGTAGERGEIPVATALGVLAVQALVTVAGPDRHLLSQCAETDCRWVFLDTSGRRHWCPSPACASRGRVRALRARRSERADG
jgi:predicted RNA-binding Zn ribbon-like protein